MGAADNPRIGELMTHLADPPAVHQRCKKQYGYLKAPLKSVVDEIVDELARDPRVAQAYELWYEMREEVLRTYKNDLPERLPLSRQKEFKSIKNMVIRRRCGWESCGRCSTRRIMGRTRCRNRKETALSRSRGPSGRKNPLQTAGSLAPHGNRRTGARGPSSKTQTPHRSRWPRRWNC